MRSALAYAAAAFGLGFGYVSPSFFDLYGRAYWRPHTHRSRAQPPGPFSTPPTPVE